MKLLRRIKLPFFLASGLCLLLFAGCRAPSSAPVVRSATDYSLFYGLGKDCNGLSRSDKSSYFPYRPEASKKWDSSAIFYQWFVPYSSDQGDTSLWLGRSYDRAVVFLDDQRVWTQPDSEIFAGYGWRLIPLPDRDVEITVCFEKGTHLSFAEPGFLDPMLIGSPAGILELLIRKELTDMGIMSVTVALAIIGIALAISLSPLRTPGMFAMSSLLISMAIYQWSTISLMDIVVDSDFIRLGLLQLGSAAFPPIFAFLLSAIYSIRWLRFGALALAFVSGLTLIHAFSIGGLHPAGLTASYSGAVSCALLLFSIGMALNQAFQGNSLGWILMPGSLVFLLYCILEYLGVVYTLSGVSVFSGRWSYLVFQISLAAAVIIQANQSRMASEKTREQKYESGRSVAENRYRTLQERMAPHFLFNSLNLIHSYIERGNPRAGDAIMMLASHYRFLINDMERRLVLFDQEWEFSRRYCQLIQFRFEDHLRIEMERHGDFGGILIPPLTIQPIIENAYRHGLRDYTSNGLIEVLAHIESDVVRIQVLDNGRGIDGSIFVSSLGGVERRLKENFRHARVTMQRRSDRGTCVEIEYSTEPLELDLEEP